MSGEDANAAARSLQVWLAGRDELRGRVRPVAATPPPGVMGAPPHLVLALAQGGAAVAGATASVLIAWVRRQSGKVSVTAKRSDGATITLTAEHVRGLTQQDIGPLVDRLTEALNGGDTAVLGGGGKPDGENSAH